MTTPLVQLGDDNDYTATTTASGHRAAESYTALKVAMNSSLSLQTSYLVKENSDIVGSAGENTDTITAINVVYDF